MLCAASFADIDLYDTYNSPFLNLTERQPRQSAIQCLLRVSCDTNTDAEGEAK